MAEISPGAASPNADLAAQVSQLAGLVGKLAEGQATLLDHLSKQAAPPPPAPAPATASDKTAGRNLTAEDVAGIVTKTLQASQTAESKRQARSNYALQKMKDVPAVYHSQLPETDDVNALATAEQHIRTRYREDLKAAGITPPPVGSHPTHRGTAPQAQPVDYSKLSNSQKIESLIAGSKPSLAGTQPAESGISAAGGRSAEAGSVNQADAM